MPKAIDVAGVRFGRLVAIARASRATKATMWRCRCDCGREATVNLSNLRGGKSKSCGCASREKSAANGRTTAKHMRAGERFGSLVTSSASRLGVSSRGRSAIVVDCVCDCGVSRSNIIAKDLRLGRLTSCGDHRRGTDVAAFAGKRFGLWLVQAEGKPRKRKSGERTVRQWLCLCDCGSKRKVSQHDLASGKSTSCGCRRRELASAFATDRAKREAESHVGRRYGWLTVVSVITGCRDTLATFKCNGRCGGAVVKRQLHRVVKGAKSRGVGPNCGCETRAAPKQSKTYLFRGQRRTRREIAEMLGVSYTAIVARTRGGAVLEVAPRRPKTYQLFGIDLTLRQLAELAGRAPQAISHRLACGLTPEQALFRGVFGRWGMASALRVNK